MDFFDINLTPFENYVLGAYHTQHAKGSNLGTMPALLGDNPKITKRAFFETRKSLAEKDLVILIPGQWRVSPDTFALPN